MNATHSHGQCVQHCCYYSFSGAETRGPSMTHGLLEGWLLCMSFHELVSRLRFWRTHRRALAGSISGWSLNAMTFTGSLLFALGNFAFYLGSFAHITCEADVALWYLPEGVSYMPVSSVWSSVLNLRTARLCQVVRDCLHLRLTQHGILTTSVRVLLVVALLSPLVYLTVALSLAIGVPSRPELPWFFYAVQFATECLVSLLLLVAIVAPIRTVERSSWELGPSGNVQCAGIDLAPIKRTWLLCFVSSLFGPVLLGMNLFQTLQGRGLNLAWWDAAYIAQSYVMYLWLAPHPKDIDAEPAAECQPSVETAQVQPHRLGSSGSVAPEQSVQFEKSSTAFRLLPESAEALAFSQLAARGGTKLSPRPGAVLSSPRGAEGRSKPEDLLALHEQCNYSI